MVDFLNLIIEINVNWSQPLFLQNNPKNICFPNLIFSTLSILIA